MDDVNKSALFFFCVISCLTAAFLVVHYYLPIAEYGSTIALFYLGIFAAFIILRLYTPKLAFVKRAESNMFDLNMKTLERDVVLAGYGSEHNITSTNVIRGDLRLDIAGHGWTSIKKKFLTAVRGIFGTQWYSENCFLLKVLEMEEYLGYEGSILEILIGIKSCNRLEELEQQLISQLILNLQDQVKSGGNTIFLDVDKMKDEESATLVSLILEKRREHFLSAMDKFRASKRNVDDLSDVLGTNYGCKVTKAIKKEIGSPKAAGYIVTQLNSVYETLLENQSTENSSSTHRRPRTRWSQLCREIAIVHISDLIDVKSDLSFHYCNPNLSKLHESGYRDIFKVLRELQPFPKLNRKEYKFILQILKGIKTGRAKKTLELLKLNKWKEMYVQS